MDKDGFSRKVLGIAALAMSVCGANAGASILFTGSGTGEAGGAVSASAEFDLTGSTLSLLLTNTSGDTAAQGDALTGILFSINGAQTLSIDLGPAPCDMSLGSGSAIWTSGTTSNTTDPICESWTDQRDVAPPIAGEFGVATTGFAGNFNGGSIGLGNASPDYGIVGALTFPGTIGGSQFPLIQNALVFDFTVTSGAFAESDITGVTFLFGTQGDDTAPGTCVGNCGGGPGGQLPEPNALWLLGMGLVALAFTRRRKARP